ncbi:MAG: tRNA (adenosine(37)-N6)-threonylcarbamoyltransferase complex dimerization subunit type 1 TsaB [Synergistaceae bacterium]|nr:tRNA (adenosine(37)-N6)-threonylcarbamoyltransferase complex dimerization subunit type 1 TsaB [Synergistaceae bacterium]
MKDILLAVDTSLRYTGIAVATEINNEFEILSEINTDIGRKQATELPDLAELVIENSGIKAKEITHIAVTNGPGYFTGVRIGMSWSSAYAFGIGADIVPVGTLEALMLSGDNKLPSIYLVYAGRNSAYAISCGFTTDLTAGEYDLNCITEWADAYKHLDYNLYCDNTEKVVIPSLNNLQKITPKISNVAKKGWEKRRSCSISPIELRANWCRSPV